MLLGFKRQFVPYVLEGSKTHTIRAKRRISPRAGETCHCYVDPRQKTMMLLGRWTCIKVEDIRILVIPSPAIRYGYDSAPDFSISINGVRLSQDEAIEFAWRDGFRPFRRCDSPIDMGHFWNDVHYFRQKTVFEGDLIHWRWTFSETNLEAIERFGRGA